MLMFISSDPIHINHTINYMLMFISSDPIHIPHDQLHVKCLYLLIQYIYHTINYMLTCIINTLRWHY